MGFVNNFQHCQLIYLQNDKIYAVLSCPETKWFPIYQIFEILMDLLKAIRRWFFPI